METNIKQEFEFPDENRETKTQKFIENLTSSLVHHLQEKGVDPTIQDLLGTILVGVNSIVEYHLLDLKNELSHVGHKLTQMEVEATTSDVVINVFSFQEKYNLRLPLETHEEFQQFDLILNDEFVCRDLELALFSLYAQKNTLSKNLTSILKSFLTREMALKFTAVKKTEGKEIFRTTKFCNYVEGFLSKRFLDEKKPPMNKSTFEKALSSVLPNAKDWDGMRYKMRE